MWVGRPYIKHNSNTKQINYQISKTLYWPLHGPFDTSMAKTQWIHRQIRADINPTSHARNINQKSSLNVDVFVIKGCFNISANKTQLINNPLLSAHFSWLLFRPVQAEITGLVRHVGSIAQVFGCFVFSLFPDWTDRYGN